MSIFGLKLVQKRLGVGIFGLDKRYRGMVGWNGLVKVHYYGIADPVVYFTIVIGVKCVKCRKSS